MEITKEKVRAVPKQVQMPRKPGWRPQRLSWSSSPTGALLPPRDGLLESGEKGRFERHFGTQDDPFLDIAGGIAQKCSYLTQTIAQALPTRYLACNMASFSLVYSGIYRFAFDAHPCGTPQGCFCSLPLFLTLAWNQPEPRVPEPSPPASTARSKPNAASATALMGLFVREHKGNGTALPRPTIGPCAGDGAARSAHSAQHGRAHSLTCRTDNWTDCPTNVASGTDRFE
jgi:hypothetical protein